MVTSGLRIGTAALATRGFQAADFTEVADLIAAALRESLDDDSAAALRDRVGALAARYPLYPALGGTAAVTGQRG
jgi:glycine hydroxymethyltransferase